MPKWTAVLALLMSGVASAEPLDEVRNAVVIVVARGVDEGNGNAPVVAQGTGFFINGNGMLVTSHHLVEQLGATVNRQSIEFEIHFDTFSPPIPANDIYASPEADVMVLYVPVGGRSIETLKPARRTSANIRLSTTPIYAAGFAAGYDYSLVPGVVTSWNGPINPLIPSWSTNLAFSPGQSGSPIVLADRRVVAIARAADANNVSRGIVVPIDFIPSQFWEDTPQGREVRSQLATLSPDSQVDRILVTASEVSRRARQVAKPIELTADACGTLSNTFSLSPAQGWQIDPASVRLASIEVGGGTALADIVRNDGAGVQVALRLTPAGRCLSVFTRRIASGPVVTYRATLHFTERPLTAVQQDIVLVDAAAIEGVEVPLTRDARNLNFFVRSADGALTAFQPEARELKREAGKTVLDVERVNQRLQRE